MAGLIEALLKAFSELTFRRFISLLLILALCFLVFVGYERFTSSFSLNRIQKSAELLSKLTELRTRNLDPESKAICDKLVGQLQKAVEADPLSLRVVSVPMVFKTDLLWKFLFGGAIWFAIALLNLRKCLRGDKDSVNLCLGMLAAGCLFGAGGIFIPVIWWPYFHLFVYPFFILFVLTFIGLILGGLAKKKQTSTTP